MTFLVNMAATPSSKNNCLRRRVFLQDYYQSIHLEVEIINQENGCFHNMAVNLPSELFK